MPHHKIFRKSHEDEWHTLLQHAGEGYFRVLHIQFYVGSTHR
jgi:hypothetical protein